MATAVEARPAVLAQEVALAPFDVRGARESFPLTADYWQHDSSVKFVGSIGYVEHFWLSLYFKGPDPDPGVSAQMRPMLEKLAVRLLSTKALLAWRVSCISAEE